MREDYGNIALDTVDDGFGEQIGSPELLRETELGGPGDGTRSCRCLASSSSWSVGFLPCWLGVSGPCRILEFL